MKNLIRSFLIAAALLPGLINAATISGTIRRVADSTVITGAKVVLIAATVQVDSVITDSTGAYSFDSAHVGATGTKTVQASATGFVTGTGNVTITTSGQSAVLTLYLTLPGDISGLVRDAADSVTPIGGALIYLRRTSATGTIVDSATTDLTGSYVFSNVAPGTPNYWVTASATGYVSATNGNLAVTASGTTTSNFYLAQFVPGTITGTVLSATDSSTAIVGASMYLRQGGAATAILDSTLTDASGQYSFTGLAIAANYRVTASATGFVTASNINTNVPNGGTTTSNFYLAVVVPGTINGLVLRTTDSTAIVGASVYLRRTSATSAIIDSTTTDVMGAYTFSNLATGTPNYWVTAAATGFVSSTSNNIAVGNGATVTRNFYLVAIVPGTITGTVRNATDSTAIVNALVVLKRGSDTSAILDSVRTDATGAYTFSNVAPLTPNYWINFSATGFISAVSANMAVANGGTTTSNVYLTFILKGAISGTVVNLGATPIPNALAVLRRGSGTGTVLDSVRTNASGIYAFGNLEPFTPNYWVTIGATGYNDSTRGNLAVANGGNTTANFTLILTVSLRPVLSNARQGIHMVRMGDYLDLDLGVSKVARTVEVINLRGSIMHRTTVSAGTSRVLVPSIYAPENGFLFQVRNR